MAKKATKPVRKLRGKANPPVPVATGLSNGQQILGVIGLIIVLSVAYIFMQGSGSTQFPAFAHSGEATPHAFSSIVNSSGSTATQSLAALAQSGLANVSQFTVNYSGSIDAHYSVFSISSPLSISDSKYAGNKRFAINVSSVEGFGPVSITYLNITKGIFTCTDFNSTALSDDNYEGALLGSHLVTCVKSETLDGFNLGEISNFDFSQLSEDGIKFYYSQVYQSTFNGVPCTYISGSFTVQQGGSNGGLFQECISDVYYIPLSFSLNESGSSGSIAVTLNENSISNSSSLAEIDSMPGKVV